MTETQGYLIGEDALRAEIERLRAALKEIAEDGGGYPAEQVVEDLQEIAREALK